MEGNNNEINYGTAVKTVRRTDKLMCDGLGCMKVAIQGLRTAESNLL